MTVRSEYNASDISTGSLDATRIGSGTITSAVVELGSSGELNVGSGLITLGNAATLNNTGVNITSLGTLDCDGTIILGSLPTSSAGLAAGQLWNDGGTVKVA